MTLERLYNRIANPSPNIMGFLRGLNSQLRVFLMDAPGESGQEYNLVLGSATASRRNAKPFIVGFIPPDNPVNFVPIKKTASTISEIGGFKAGAGDPIFNGTNADKFLGPSKGKQKRERKPVKPEDLRQGLIDAYVKIGGTLPSPETLCLMFAQKALENGLSGEKREMHTWNYNLGSIHANGRAGAYNKGPDGVRKPQFGVERQPEAPRSGTYYFGEDGYGATAQDDRYPIAFLAFDNFDQAVTYQVAYLAQKHPGSLTATNAKDYNNALLPSRGIGQSKAFGRDYHQSGDVYENSLRTQCNAYNVRLTDDGRKLSELPIESDAVRPAIVDNPENIKSDTRELVTDNVTTDFETDPVGDRMGRNIEQDKDRTEIVNLQTAALQQQIDLISSTPPLIMLINPSTFDRSYENSADSSPKTRSGNVVHTWLERPMKISCSGITAGQYVWDAEGAGGLTGQNRVHSLSYGNLLSLVNMYRNNGIIYSGPETKGEIGTPIIPFTIFIYYDNHIYLGSFDDFSVDDTAERAFNMAYSFNFTVRYDQHLDNSPVDLDIASAAAF